MTFKEIIAPFTQEAFMSEYFGKKFLLIKGSPNKFDHVFGWESLNRILNTQKLEYPRVRLVQFGERMEEDDFADRVTSKRGAEKMVLNSNKVNNLVNNGATLILDAVNEMDNSINEFTRSFERFFHETAQANSYTAVSDNQGFDLHWDSHDVFVIQISGRKYWRMYSDTRKFPMYTDVDQNIEPPKEDDILWEGHLESGDILYIPRGWWHEAKPVEEETMHLSIGIRHTTGLDVLEWLKSKVATEEFFRMDVPKPNQKNQLNAYQKNFSNKIEKYFSEGFVEEFIRFNSATSIPKSHTFSFGQAINNNGIKIKESDKIRLAHFVDFHIAKYGNDQVVIDYMKKRWTFSSLVIPVIENLKIVEQITILDLYKAIENEVSYSNFIELIESLLKEGFIVIT